MGLRSWIGNAVLLVVAGDRALGVGEHAHTCIFGRGFPIIVPGCHRCRTGRPDAPG